MEMLGGGRGGDRDQRRQGHPTGNRDPAQHHPPGLAWLLVSWQPSGQQVRRCQLAQSQLHHVHRHGSTHCHTGHVRNDLGDPGAIAGRPDRVVGED